MLNQKKHTHCPQKYKSHSDDVNEKWITEVDFMSIVSGNLCCDDYTSETIIFHWDSLGIILIELTGKIDRLAQVCVCVCVCVDYSN